jgi:hypothetical protein
MANSGQSNELPDSVLAAFLRETRQPKQSTPAKPQKIQLPGHIRVLDPKAASRTRRENAQKELLAMIERPELRRSKVVPTTSTRVLPLAPAPAFAISASPPPDN